MGSWLETGVLGRVDIYNFYKQIHRNRRAMSSRKRKISLNCSLSIPSTTSTSSTTILNTPEILDTVLNITAEQPHFPQHDNLTRTEVAGEIANNIEIKEENATYEDHEMNKKIKVENEIPAASDEERRRRRRERNKVAATKCRNKKKEQTMTLMRESQSVQNLNISLKQEISRLESEEKDLRALLAHHRAHCLRNVDECPRAQSGASEPDRFYTFGQNINLDGGALNSEDIEENIDKDSMDSDARLNDKYSKEEKAEFPWEIQDSHNRHGSNTNFPYFGTNFNLGDSSCGNQSMSNRFIGVDSRFIML